MPRADLDAIDRRILATLQEDGRLTNVELAERIGLSPSPCLRRVKRLEREGVIAGYRATLDRARGGLGVTVSVGIKIESHQDKGEATFTTAIRRLPEVVACHIVSGDFDYLAQVVVPDLEAYERFLLGTLLKIPGVKDVRSHFAIRTVKPPAPLPLAHLPGPRR